MEGTTEYRIIRPSRRYLRKLSAPFYFMYPETLAGCRPGGLQEAISVQSHALVSECAT